MYSCQGTRKTAFRIGLRIVERFATAELHVNLAKENWTGTEVATYSCGGLVPTAELHAERARRPWNGRLEFSRGWNGEDREARQ